MQYLKKTNQTKEATFYRVGGDHEGTVHRHLVTTPWSREILNRPEVVGCQFTQNLKQAMTAALKAAPFRPVIEDTPQERVCVLNFLRGGLNFNLREALCQAYGFNTHSSAFMSSQRYKEEGRWGVKEDMYRKLEIPSGAVLVMGDVVATGVTMRNGLEVLLDHVRSLGSSIKSLVFFTIGCHKLEKNLQELEPAFREAFPDYEATHIIYIEGKFKLVDSRTPLKIGLPGTDLLRNGGLLAPEFELSQYDSPSSLLERCTIYDAGSRAFDVPSYVADVAEYWKQTLALAREGWTLQQAYEERWPAPDYASLERLMEAKKALWPGIDEAAFLKRLYRAHERHSNWVLGADSETGHPPNLAALAQERIEALHLTLEGGRKR